MLGRRRMVGRDNVVSRLNAATIAAYSSTSCWTLRTRQTQGLIHGRLNARRVVTEEIPQVHRTIAQSLEPWDPGMLTTFTSDFLSSTSRARCSSGLAITLIQIPAPTRCRSSFLQAAEIDESTTDLSTTAKWISEGLAVLCCVLGKWYAFRNRFPTGRTPDRSLAAVHVWCRYPLRFCRNQQVPCNTIQYDETVLRIRARTSIFLQIKAGLFAIFGMAGDLAVNPTV